MSSNPFALLDVDGQTETKKVAAPKKAAPKAAPKKDAKAVAAPQKKEVAPKTLEKKPLASGERDRHSKGGRNAGEANTKRPFDRSLNRQTTGQHERKGGDSKGVKGSWATKNPEADQVAADVEQKKDEAEAKVEEAKVEVVEKKPEEPAPFLLADALKQKKAVVGERTKARAPTAAADSKAINTGAKPSAQVQSITKGQSKINANKKTFNIDEFMVVNGGAEKQSSNDDRQQRQRKANRNDFPAL